MAWQEQIGKLALADAAKSLACVILAFLAATVASASVVTDIETIVRERIAAVAHVDPATYDAYAGRYRLDSTHIVRVWRDGSKLLSQADGEARATELLPSARDTFFVDGDLGEYVFGRGHDGVVDRMLFRMSGSPDITLQRIVSP